MPALGWLPFPAAPTDQVLKPCCIVSNKLHVSLCWPSWCFFCFVLFFQNIKDPGASSWLGTPVKIGVAGRMFRKTSRWSSLLYWDIQGESRVCQGEARVEVGWEESRSGPSAHIVLGGKPSRFMEPTQGMRVYLHYAFEPLTVSTESREVLFPKN